MYVLTDFPASIYTIRSLTGTEEYKTVGNRVFHKVGCSRGTDVFDCGILNRFKLFWGLVKSPGLYVCRYLGQED